MTEKEENQTEEVYFTLPTAFDVGRDFSFLRRAAEHQYPVRSSDSIDGDYILGTLDRVIYSLEHSDVETSIISDMKSELRYLSNEYPPKEASRESELDNISMGDAARLRSKIEAWSRSIRTDLHKMQRYTPVTDRFTDIISSAEGLFSDEDTWETLPEQARNDLTQSARALSFGAPTGSVFLSLRAVEQRLREWYKIETGRDIEGRTFGEVIGELDDIYDDDDDEKPDRPSILSHLDSLKERRNEVAHPERSADIQEAESTLFNVRQTIREIQDKLDEENPG
jgi:hypothetical protein